MLHPNDSGGTPQARSEHVLPPDVEEFVSTRLRTVAELDLLLLASEQPQREWAPDEMARLVGRQAGEVRRSLRALAQKGLLRSRQGGEALRFVYLPDQELSLLVDRLARLYPRMRLSVVARLGTSPPSGKQDWR
jgi:hypothetical protein